MNSKLFLLMCMGSAALTTLVAWSAAGQEAAEAADVAAPASEAVAAPTEPPSEALMPPPMDPAAVTAGGTGGVSQAEEFVRRGVALYGRELYSEALSEFNRALALEPDNAQARQYLEMCNSKLQITATGADLAGSSSFVVLDPEAISQQNETPQPTAQEIKHNRVKQLLEWGQQYLDAQKFATAVEIYQEVLLIEPANEIAKAGLHDATLGVSRLSITEREKEVEEFRQKVRQYTEESKLPPEGADARGIKPYTLRVPLIEEKFEEVKEKTEVEKALESPVNIEFENIHISEIAEFVSDTWEINIVIDNRVVEPPRRAVPQQPGAAPGAPGAPAPGGFPAAPGGAARTGPFGTTPQPAYGGAAAPGPYGAAAGPYGAARQQQGAAGLQGETYLGYRTNGMVPYINLSNVTLSEALRALLRPLGLDYSVQKSFLWISTPKVLRSETFETLETRFYELRNAGQQTLFKIVLRNRFGGTGGGFGGGGYGGGGRGGGYGGGGYGGGGYGGGGYGGGGYGGGGYGGGGYGGGGYGGGGGGFGGGGYGGGGFGGGGYGGGGFGGGGYGGGGYGGGGYGGGGYGGGGRGGGYGGGGMDVTSVSNISDLFSTISDIMVGEPQANPGIVGIRDTGTGATARTGQPAGTYGTNQAATLGQGTQNATTFDNESPIIALLGRLVDDVYEPTTNERLSEMIYNPATNMLIVKNTPTNLEKLEKYIAEIDVTPRQVSIEAKFLTIRVSDLDKVGFKWDLKMSDKNSRVREIEGFDSESYDYDINGDGVDETIPFYVRPDGTNVITNTITDGVLSAVVNPAPNQSTFNFVGQILNNEDGDSLGLTFDFLDSLSESELLSAPRVTTMNLKPAVIADFTTEYFVSAVETYVATSDAGFGGTPTTTFSQRVIPQSFNFGISLSVTPQIGDNDQVRLWLNPEVRTRIGQKSFEQTSIVNDTEVPSTIILPTTSWQSVWTNVIVHDGDTLVLGGLVSDTSIKSEDRMPYLANIPLLGFFFRGKGKEVSQQSLLIFVTPDIIDTTGAKFFEAPQE